MALEFLTSYFTAKNQKAPAYAGDVDVSKTTQKAAQANIDAMPYIQKAITNANQYNQAQNLQMLNQAVPGYNKWSNTMVTNAQDWASGKMSDEMASNLTRMAAERGISTGLRGQSGQFSLLRDLGINQMQSAQASQNVMHSIASMSKVNPMSPLSLMASPQDALGVAESNRSAYQGWLNAEQAAQNVRKNAFWSGLAAGDATFQQASGMGGGGGDVMGGSGGGGGWGSFMSMFKGGAGSGGSAMSGAQFGGGATDLASGASNVSSIA